MGLDITVYKNLKIVKNLEFNGYTLDLDTQWGVAEDIINWIEMNFEGRTEGVEANVVYEWEENFKFKAGSYMYYNWWRAELRNFSKDTAFQELINFANNVGVIGLVVAKKLANDFVENSKKAENFSKTLGKDGERWLKKYNQWQQAFIMASENGAVDFH